MVYNRILHVDMDAFFASVEQLDHPEWRDVALIVGGRPEERGVVASCSYEARRFGVRAGMPMRRAAQLCPHAIFAPGRRWRYSEISAQLYELLLGFTPFVEMASIDEAFLGLSGVQDADEPIKLAQALKASIRNELGLTASVGIASNMFLAKLASDLQKPDGLTVMPVDAAAIKSFLAPLPIRRVWGVGTKTEALLHDYGFKSIGDLQASSPELLSQLLGNAAGRHLFELAHGRDERQVEWQPALEKSLSKETTFSEDCGDMQQARQYLRRLCEEVGARLRRQKRLAGAAHIKLRYSDFRTIPRQMPLKPVTCSDRVLLRAADQLFDAVEKKAALRLIGFGVSKIVEETAAVSEPQEQLLLFPEKEQLEAGEAAARDASLDRAVDQLRERFGDDILRRG